MELKKVFDTVQSHLSEHFSNVDFDYKLKKDCVLVDSIVDINNIGDEIEIGFMFGKNDRFLFSGSIKGFEVSEEILELLNQLNNDCVDFVFCIEDNILRIRASSWIFNEIYSIVLVDYYLEKFLELSNNEQFNEVLEYREDSFQKNNEDEETEDNEDGEFYDDWDDDYSMRSDDDRYDGQDDYWNYPDYWENQHNDD